MSGGHFDYAYSRVQGFAEDLSRDLHSDLSEIKLFVAELPEEVIAALEAILKEADAMAAKMRAAEWLFSGDTGPESFLEEIKSIGRSSPTGEAK